MNDVEIIGQSDKMIEWDSFALQAMIAKKLKGAKIKSIKIKKLEATTDIAQELIDFLLRQEIEEGGLEVLKLKDLQKLDKPFDKGIFD